MTGEHSGFMAGVYNYVFDARKGNNIEIDLLLLILGETITKS